LSIERRVIDLLENPSEPMHVDDITRTLGEASQAVSSVLVMLELTGCIPSGRFDAIHCC
ncbi:MAG: hypothetical protein HN798_09940, partial [Chloroflexi bacterium]|nr:hypothetical protein [Chloroflexota bacterium]